MMMMMNKKRSSHFQPVCPLCQRKFALKDASEHRNAAANPILLACGHSICCSCFVSSCHTQKAVSCPSCKTLTPAKIPEQLDPNLYALGVLYDGRRCFNRYSSDYNVRMVPSGFGRSNSTIVSPGSVISFDRCSNCHGSANLICLGCGNKVTCSKCFAIFHNQSGLADHKFVSIRGQSAPALRTCSHHEHKLLEYYCTEDEERICSDCLVVGDHKGHNVERYCDQVKELVGNVEEKVKTMQKTNKCLKYSEKYLLRAMEESKEADEKCIEQIRQHFLYIHGILQRRESYLIDQVRSKSERQQNLISETLNNLRVRRGRLSCLITDVKSHLNWKSDSKEMRSGSEYIYENLQEFSDVECYLLSDTSPLEMFSAKFDSCPTDLTVVREHGAVDVDPEVTDLKFVSSRDVDDALLDDISDDEGIPELELCSAQSSDESVFSAISSASRANGASVIPSSASSVSSLPRSHKSNRRNRRGAQQPRHLVSTRGPKPRQWRTMSQEMVRVCHICTPSEFFIQRKCDQAMLIKQQESIRDFCKSKGNLGSINPKDIRKGELYLVYYANSKEYCRGQLIDIIEANDVASCKRNTLYSVVYIDYGNVESVPIERIATIPKQFESAAPFSIKCSLFGIEPVDKAVGWTQESLKRFATFVDGKLINMMVFEPNGKNRLQIDLGECDSSLNPNSSTPVSVRDALVFLELGCFSHSVGASNGSSSLPSPLSIIPSCCKFFQQPLPLLNTTVNVLVSYTQSPTSFYIHKVEDLAAVVKLLDEMQKAYDSLKWDVGLCNPVEGMACVAKNDDGKWYRARVLGSPGSRLIKVFYVDFGDTDVLPHTRVKAIYPRLLQLPEMCYHCSLADVLPVDGGQQWSKEAIEYFTSFVDVAPLKLHVVGHVEQSLLVTLYLSQDSEEVCLNYRLVLKEFAISSGPCSLTERVRKRNETEKADTKQLLQPNLNPLWPEVSKPKSTTTDSNPPRNAKGEALYNAKVHVSHLVSPTIIYVQFIEQDGKLKKLMENIQYTYGKSTYIEKEWTVDDMCVVYSLQDKLWHRAIVAQVVSVHELKVFLVDWGRTFVVAPDLLRAISDIVRVAPHFAFRCHLAEILAPGGSDRWPSVAIEFLSDIVNKHDVLFLTKLERSESLDSSDDFESFPVDLFYQEVTVRGALDPMTTDYFSLTDLLLENGLALPSKARRMPRVRKMTEDVEPASGGYFNFEPAADEMDDSDESSISNEFSVLNGLEDVSFVSSCFTDAPMVPMEKWIPAKVPNGLGRRFEVLPTNVTMKGLVCMHDTLKAAQLLKTIENTLKLKYENSLPSPRDLYWAPGQACVAQFDMDNNWYRAEVMSVSSKDNKILVSFVDYGNVENVRPDQLRKDICLLQHPQQGFYGQLFNVAPLSGDEWPVSTLNWIHKAIVDKKCYVTIMVSGSDERPPKVVIEITEGNSLNDLLVEMKLARNVGEEEEEIVSEALQYELGYLDAVIPDLESMVPITITDIVSPTSFYVQRVSVNEEEDAARQRSQKTMDNVAATWPRITEPKIGNPCVSRFTVDDKWFRAVIVDVNEAEESVTVIYVDYGNQETVGLDRIREIPAELIMAMPKQAFLCELFQVCPVDTWTVELNNKLLKVLNAVNDEPYMIEVMEIGTSAQVNLHVVVKESNEIQLAYQQLVNDNLLKLVRKKTWEEIA